MMWAVDINEKTFIDIKLTSTAETAPQAAPPSQTLGPESHG